MEEEKIVESASFKEETNVVGELPDPQKVALDELKELVQEALNKHEFTAPPPAPAVPAKEEEKPAETVGEKSPVPATEEAKSEVPPETATPAVAEPATEEPPKSEPEVAAPPPSVEEEKSTPPPPPAAEPVVVVAEVVEKVQIIDDEGAKTVEAIEETIVAVATAVPPPEEPAPTEVAPSGEPKAETEAEPENPEAVSIWGIPLLADERSDVVLLKFLRARDFKVKEAFVMFTSVVARQKEFDALHEEDFGSELEKVVFMDQFDN